MSHFGQVYNTNIKQNKRLDIYYAKGPHIIFGKVVAGQPHAGLSLSAPYRHQRVTRWHTDRSVHPDVTPFSVYTAPRSSDPRFRPSCHAGHEGGWAKTPMFRWPRYCGR